jgi:hypothetical protein
MTATITKIVNRRRRSWKRKKSKRKRTWSRRKRSRRKRSRRRKRKRSVAEERLLLVCTWRSVRVKTASSDSMYRHRDHRQHHHGRGLKSRGGRRALNTARETRTKRPKTRTKGNNGRARRSGGRSYCDTMAYVQGQVARL